MPSEPRPPSRDSGELTPRPVRPEAQPVRDSRQSGSDLEQEGASSPQDLPKTELQPAAVEGAQEPESSSPRHHPIPPPSEPLQYRAIGLIKGHYIPSEEQFTKGILKTEDGTELNAVLLGRVMNLVKKYLDSDRSYLWVVYPRTREKAIDLHVQIMGVWAPAEMGQPLPEEAEPEPESDFFSIRGEVVFQSQAKQFVIVKIRQAGKKSTQGKPQTFKLRLQGDLPSKAVGAFWDLEVSRQGSELQIEQGTQVAVLPKPRSKPIKSRHHPPGKPIPKHAAPAPPPRPQGKPEKPQRFFPILKPMRKKRPEQNG